MKDVIVVGAGPAGSSTARAIRKNSDKDVTILEKRLVPEASCAGGLGVHMKNKAGLDDIPDDVLECEIHEVEMCTDKHSLSYSTDDLGIDEPMGITVDREMFDLWLLDLAIKEGTEAIYREQVQDIEKKDDRYVLKTSYNRKYESEYVVLADGARSNLAPKIGIDTDVGEDMHIGYQETITDVDYKPDKMKLFFSNEYAPGGYMWFFPEQEGLRVGCGVPRTEGSPKYYLKKYFKDNPEFDSNGTKTINRLGGLIPTTKPIKSYKDKVALVGDSARHTSALHGGGIAHAIKGGKILGETIAEDLPLKMYQKQWKASYGKRLKREYKVKQLIFKKGETPLDRIFKAVEDYTPQSINIEKEIPRLVKHIVKKDIGLAPKLLRSALL